MSLSCKKPAKCVRELRSPEHAPALHQAVLADGRARCQRRPRREHRRDVLPPPAGASDRGVKQAQLWATPRRPRHSRSSSASDRASGQDRRRLAGGAHSPRHVIERLRHDDHDPAARGHIGRRDEPKQRRTSVDISLGHGQHSRQRTLAAMKAAFPHVVLCFIPPRSTSQAWTTGWHRLRAGSNAEFREAVAEAAALHSRDDLFSRHIEPEPAPEGPVDWAMAEASDDEDDAAWWRPGEAIDQKNCPCIISHRPSVVSRVRCRVCLCSKCPDQAPRQ